MTTIKKTLSIAVIVVFVLGIAQTVAAHSGRTDRYGGHTCRTNCPKYGLSYGEYHYHNSGITTPTVPTVTIPTTQPSNSVKTDRHGLSADSGLSVVALDNYELKKWPSDIANRVDNRKSFGALMLKGWAGNVVDSTSDAIWFNVDLNGNQSGWIKGEYLKVVK